jgi:hypothetical protein
VREKSQQITLKDLAALHAAPGATPSVRPAAADQIPSDLPGQSSSRTFPVERLNYQDIQLVESFFQRQKELVNKDALAWQLLQRLLAKMEVDAASVTSQTLEVNLRTILAEYRQYHVEE